MARVVVRGLGGSKATGGIIESQRMVLKAKFSRVYFSKLLNHMMKFGVVLVGTNISNDEYFVCTQKTIIYQEAERLALNKFNYKTERNEFFNSKIINQYNPYYNNKDIKFKAEDIFTESEIILVMDNYLRCIPIDMKMRRYLPFSRQDEMLIPYFIRKGIISHIYPQHNPFTIYRIWPMTKSKLIYPVGSDICYYFGEEVAFYFEWISFYWFWLFYPAAVGLIIFIHSVYIGKQKMMDKNPFMPVYAGFVIIWGFLFTKFWKRRQTFLSYEWDTLGRKKIANVRANFEGKEIYNEVTGERELYFPHYKKTIRICVTTSVVILMSSIAFFLIICSFNLRGFISEKTHAGSTNFFFLESLNQFSHKDAIFASHGSLFWVPIVMHTTCLYIMNSILFKRVALNLTEWENHKTESDFLFYLILKRSLFDSFDSYCGLFYMAFYERDSEKLRIVLHSVFISDTIRRLVIKCFLPWLFLKVKYEADVLLNRTTHKKRKSLVEFWNSMATIDTYMADYDSFDDYLEMVIEFGYISLFASVSVVTGFLAIVSNLIDLKTDCMKLLFLFKRPLVNRADATGPWLYIISFITWLSVLTNIFIFGLTSEQMKSWYPQYFVGHAFHAGSGHKAVGLLVLYEHMFILIGLCIHFGINSIPRVIRKRLNNEEKLKTNAFLQNFKAKRQDILVN